jgi:nicotinate-nucleotide adenylyltransferase
MAALLLATQIALIAPVPVDDGLLVCAGARRLAWLVAGQGAVSSVSSPACATGAPFSSTRWRSSSSRRWCPGCILGILAALLPGGAGLMTDLMTVLLDSRSRANAVCQLLRQLPRRFRYQRRRCLIAPASGRWEFSAAPSIRFISATCVSPKRPPTVSSSPACAGFRPAGRLCAHAPQVTARQRLAMVRLATADNPRFTIDAAEVEAARPSYTVPTLERLRQADQCGRQRPLVLLIGADAFAGLPGWHRWQSLFDLAHIAVAHRPGFSIDSACLPAELASCYRDRFCGQPGDCWPSHLPGRIVTFAMTQLAISATQIRGLLAKGSSPRYLLPDKVIAYILTKHLYPEY